MNNNLKNKKFQIFLLIVLFLLFLKVDYRFDTSIRCCSDEYDYFSHSSTIVFDFDLDYSNQNLREFNYSKNGKTTPIGFFGSGLLSAPFLWFGSKLSSIFNENINSTVLNFQFFLYSMSSVFYFFISFFLILNTLKKMKINVNKYNLLLYLSGSGITYYAFERFGMTHVFELFGISLLFNLCINFYIQKNNIKFSIFIPIVLMICFLTRMSNFYIFLLPYVAKIFLKDSGFKNLNNLYKSTYFWISFCISSYIYYLISFELYGELILNPQKVYGTNISFQNVYESQSNFLELILSLFKTLSIILFSNEFGILWISPIIFLGFVSIFFIKSKAYILNFLVFICFAQNFFIVHIWQSLGSSYGFRYLFSLTPLSIFLYFVYLKKYKFIRYYLLPFSIFSNLSLLFFETTIKTQLSTIDQINSFGRSIRYVEPEYVSGLLLSFFEFESYLIIFTTSFFGALLFKIVLLILSQDSLFLILERFGLPIYNEDFLSYINNIQKIQSEKFLILLIYFSFVSYKIVNYKNKT